MKVERTVNGLELDWETTHEQLVTQMRRITRRAHNIEAQQPDLVGVSPEGPEGENQLLSAKQLEANAKILARRARMRGPANGGD